ncbi:MAG: hypothetical protein MUF43_08830 [Flavobacterium sp.]|nr:hypothetical protein [Flavobacterium sp.]
MKKISFLILTLLMFSCTQDDARTFSNDIYPYYKFSTSEENYRLLHLTLNKEIEFKNQNDEIIKFKVVSNELRKLENSSGTFSGGSILNNYYDAQIIKLRSVTDSFEEATLEFKIYKFDNEKVNVSFYFYKWNINSSSQYMQSFNLNLAPTQQMMINSVNYANTLEVNSNSLVSIQSNNGYLRNVNKLFYDQRNGLVGFNDLEGKEWRLQQ